MHVLLRVWLPLAFDSTSAKWSTFSAFFFVGHIVFPFGPVSLGVTAAATAFERVPLVRGRESWGTTRSLAQAVLGVDAPWHAECSNCAGGPRATLFHWAEFPPSGYRRNGPGPASAAMQVDVSFKLVPRILAFAAGILRQFQEVVIDKF